MAAEFKVVKSSALTGDDLGFLDGTYDWMAGGAAAGDYIYAEAMNAALHECSVLGYDLLSAAGILAAYDPSLAGGGSANVDALKGALGTGVEDATYTLTEGDFNTAHVKIGNSCGKDDLYGGLTVSLDAAKGDVIMLGLGTSKAAVTKTWEEPTDDTKVITRDYAWARIANAAHAHTADSATSADSADFAQKANISAVASVIGTSGSYKSLALSKLDTDYSVTLLRTNYSASHNLGLLGRVPYLAAIIISGTVGTQAVYESKIACLAEGTSRQLIVNSVVPGGAYYRILLSADVSYTRTGVPGTPAVPSTVKVTLRAEATSISAISLTAKIVPLAYNYAEYDEG